MKVFPYVSLLSVDSGGSHNIIICTVGTCSTVGSETQPLRVVFHLNLKQANENDSFARRTDHWWCSRTHITNRCHSWINGHRTKLHTEINSSHNVWSLQYGISSVDHWVYIIFFQPTGWTMMRHHKCRCVPVMREMDGGGMSASTCSQWEHQASSCAGFGSW